MGKSSVSHEKLDINKFIRDRVLLISLCNDQLFFIRIFHALIKKYTPVKTVFFKKHYAGATLGKEHTPTEKEYKLLMDLIKDFKPGMVGISFRSSYLPMAKEITERIRKISDALILWGGIHSVLSPEECIKYADMVCVGEGEIPLKNLFERKSLDGFWIKHDGKIFFNTPRVLTDNLDDLPVPDFKDENKYCIDKDRITAGDPINECRVYSIMASRGCPFNCSYCINSVLKEIYHGQRLLRLRGVDSVIDELKAIKKESKNLRRILFMDEIFALGRKKWIEEFAKKYKKEIGLPFGLEYRPDMVREDLLMILKDAGLDNMTIGLESGSYRVRKEVYLRDVSDEQMLECQRMLKKVGILGVYNIIVKNPLETVDDLKKGFDFIMKFPRPFSFHIYKLVNFPKTRLTERFIAEGIIKNNNFGLNNVDHEDIIAPSKNSEEDFWINMIGLSSKGFIPKWFLRFMGKNEYFIKHQSFVYYLTRVSNFVKFLMDGFRWAKKEGFSYGIIISGVKNFKGYLRKYR